MAGTLAIDLGSTTTVVAWQEERGEPRLLALPPYSGGDPCAVPSLLWLSHPGQTHPLIGRQVVEAGLADRGGPGLCRDFKRSIGQAREVTPGLTGSGESGSWLSPEAAGELLLRRLWEALPPDLEPARLILTAPVESCAGYGRWLREVCAALPVEEIALVDEPTAAAIGSGLPPGSRVLVVDFGGGTLDVSLVALQGGEGRAAPVARLLRFAGRDLAGSRQRWRTARVLGKAGVPLGGRDLDRWIAADLCPDQPLTADLLGLAEALKCAVSDQEEALRILPSSDGGGRAGASPHPPGPGEGSGGARPAAHPDQPVGDRGLRRPPRRLRAVPDRRCPAGGGKQPSPLAAALDPGAVAGGSAPG